MLLGVHGKNLPTKKSQGVIASNFLIGGMVAFFERKFDKAFAVKSPQEAQDIFGKQISSSIYGPDALAGFFANIAGIDATLYISSHVGHTGSAIDGVTASQNLPDQQVGPAVDVLKVQDAYESELGYGVSGNRTGVTVTNGTRYTSAILTTGTKDDLFVIVTTPGAFKVGDIIKVVATDGGGATVYKKVTAVDELTGKISFAGAFHASANAAATDVVTILGFRLRLWRKEITGVVSEVEPDLGSVWCSTEPECQEYYAPNIFAASKWVKVTRLVDAVPADPHLIFPADITTVTYPTNGADGTAPTTAAHWAHALSLMDGLPVRILCNPETTDAAIQKAIQTYCKAREDTPKVIVNWPSNQTKAQGLALGGAWLGSGDGLAIGWLHWLKVTDPFNPNVPNMYRAVPNVGHMLGYALQIIGTKGIHYAWCQKDVPLAGCTDVYGTQFTADQDRTDLSAVGVNCIQNLPGYGIIPRNSFALSSAEEFRHIQGPMLRDMIKVSAVDSLQGSENKPNTFARIVADKMAVLSFIRRLWLVGSTGNVPEGESLGQTINADGTATKFDQHYSLQADLVNNPQSEIQAGHRHIDGWITYPAEANTIEIGVGILLLS
jgi:hypothetical protein